MKKIKILMATAEMAPFAKVGGLADVVGSLPMAIKENDCDVRIIIPLYGAIDKEKYGLKIAIKDVNVTFDGELEKVDIWQCEWNKVIVYFIDYKKYFGESDIYQPGGNTQRYLFFSEAVLCSISALEFFPDVIHCHDYHTAMIPFLLKYSCSKNLRHISTILTIHNLQYQGKISADVLKMVNVKNYADNSVDFMEQGIINADYVTTVSPTYAKEIMTKNFGEGLELLLKRNKKKVSGVLNGIDMDLYNPLTDKFIPKNYSVDDLSGKAINKNFLQKEFNLPIGEQPLIGLVSRFVEQKGLKLITEAIAELDCQFVFLGTGEKIYEDNLNNLKQKYPDKISVQTKFDIKLAQLVYAGSDIFLMPSRFEPCGLGQMIAMRYGSVPVVRAVGGLADTVFEGVNGFVFEDMTTEALLTALKRACHYFYDKNKWRKIQFNGMTSDFSWDVSAKKYIGLYNEFIS